MLSLLACFSFIVYHMLTFIRYIEVYFMIALLDYVRYNEDFVTQRFVKSRFCSIHFTVILAGPKKIVRYTEDFVTDRGSLNQGSNQNSYDICISKVENVSDTGLYYTR